MRKLLPLIFILGIYGCHTVPDIAPSPEISGNYVLDPTHASVVWSLSHSGLSNYTARFDDISGTLNFDSANPENSRVHIRIDPASVSTGLPEFDQKLITDARYFDADNHPDIRFTSTAIETLSADEANITGDLFFRGKRQPVTLSVKFNGAGKSFGHPGDTLGFSATGVLSRSAFGLTYLSNFGIGDDVTLRIETEFNEIQNDKDG
jgi:polyisoprenoid-binding protein YceI